MVSHQVGGKLSDELSSGYKISMRKQFLLSLEFHKAGRYTGMELYDTGIKLKRRYFIHTGIGIEKIYTTNRYTIKILV